MKYTQPNGEANTMERHNCLMMRCFTLSLNDDTLLLYEDTLGMELQINIYSNNYTYLWIIENRFNSFEKRFNSTTLYPL